MTVQHSLLNANEKEYRIKSKTYKKACSIFLNVSVPSAQGKRVLASKDIAEISSTIVILPLTDKRARV